MSSTVLFTIIVGLICILFPFIYHKNRTLRLGVGSIGVILLTYGGFIYGTMQPIPYMETFNKGNQLEVHLPAERIQIISPINKDTVKCRILTMGVYPESHQQDIWVLLKPSDKKYYPQSDYTNTSYKRKGEWQVVTRFGGDAGEQYEIIVMETDALASQFFSETIANWKAANDYAGLEFEELPDGAVEVERITVTLEDSCRGAN